MDISPKLKINIIKWSKYLLLFWVNDGLYSLSNVLTDRKWNPSIETILFLRFIETIYGPRFILYIKNSN